MLAGNDLLVSMNAREADGALEFAELIVKSARINLEPPFRRPGTLRSSVSLCLTLPHTLATSARRIRLSRTGWGGARASESVHGTLGKSRWRILAVATFDS